MPALIPHNGVSETFVCRDCMTLIDPAGHEYPDYSKADCDQGKCPLCGGTDTAWLFADPVAIGRRIGRAIAHDVRAEDMPREWTGLDPQDTDVATAAGLEPDTTEWEEMEAAAREEYGRIAEGA